MRVYVIGAGAAGMMAAITAAKSGHSVTVLEKNEKAGKKIYITGKGRCNLTNACDNDTFFRSVKRNPRFLYSSYSAFSAYDAIDAFEQMGLKTKVERGNRVFPVSDKSSDVIKALENEMKRLGVTVLFNTKVTGIKAAGAEKVLYTESREGQKAFEADAVVIATGGLSYRSTGSDGDGYRFAKEFGHSVTPCTPSLVALELVQKTAELEGLSLKNVTLTVTGPVPSKGGFKVKEIYRDFGEMLFTRNGISGPLVLSASAELSPIFSKDCPEKTFVHIDLKPALTYEQLDLRVLRDFEANINKNFGNSLYDLLPSRLADLVVRRSGIDPLSKVNTVTAGERERLVKLLKDLEFEVAGLAGFNEAVITCGGVNVKEVDPKTMESKLVPGVYFAGEVLDLDALTGGFNLQIAWSTGVCAGNNIGL
ncbi:MAG: NAD(P)/FAD-dependent oxidoreductase [Lachnospiraceae bacterium]|nr:NAD(P)/FAD-dependent oxidoreductase [Lachnospiraceae bacterium]